MLQKHAAPVSHVAMQPGAGKRMLLSLAEDGTLHCYDLSSDAETGQGKLVFRRRLPPTYLPYISPTSPLYLPSTSPLPPPHPRRLPADLAPSWLRFTACVPLVLLADAAWSAPEP